MPLSVINTDFFICIQTLFVENKMLKLHSEFEKCNFRITLEVKIESVPYHAGQDIVS